MKLYENEVIIFSKFHEDKTNKTENAIFTPMLPAQHIRQNYWKNWLEELQTKLLQPFDAE